MANQTNGNQFREDEIIILRDKNEASRSKLRGILSGIAPKPYAPSLSRATARSPRHSSLQQAAEYPWRGGSGEQRAGHRHGDKLFDYLCAFYIQSHPAQEHE
jgi:hypothetical protein